jgi:hypothetical protein
VRTQSLAQKRNEEVGMRVKSHPRHGFYITMNAEAQGQELALRRSW